MEDNFCIVENKTASEEKYSWIEEKQILSEEKYFCNVENKTASEEK